MNTNVNQPDTGPKPIKGVENIVNTMFPQFRSALQKYCRPKASIDLIFEDFNFPQRKTYSPSKSRINDIFSSLEDFIPVDPYDCVHWCDTRFYNFNLSSKVDYFHLHNSNRIKEAKLNHPDEATLTTKKHYFINAHLYHDRAVVHNIKLYGYPFVPTKDHKSNEERLHNWFLTHPTELLVRSHLSTKDKLKVRPVYNVSFLFLRIEMMLCWPFIAQLRRSDSQMLYGYETIRGGMARIEELATLYNSFILIDWKKYDHRAPYSISDIFFQQYLPSKIAVDEGYAKIRNYQEHIHNFNMQARNINKDSIKYSEHQTMPDIYPDKISNLLNFLHRWYNEMIYVTPDGFAYRRKFAGLPSGLMLTQPLDSWINYFLIIDSMYEFGLTKEEISKFKIFVLGDDNIIMSPYSLQHSQKLFECIKSYTSKKYDMLLSFEKCKVTNLRSEIEVLGYRNNYGYPVRDTLKMVGQLAFPERHCAHDDMCTRAVGLAYASAGCDLEYFQLCNEVFKYYSSKLPTPLSSPRLQALPGSLFMLNEYQYVDLTHFPTIEDVRRRTSTWSGKLPLYPFWNNQYFIEGPGIYRNSLITLLHYRTFNNLIEP